MLRELSVAEQRYRAVFAVIEDDVSVTGVAANAAGEPADAAQRRRAARRRERAIDEHFLPYGLDFRGRRPRQVRLQGGARRVSGDRSD